jgi:ribose/xylose/arabinose/galactoside ABC-type transport system permease subunit
MNPHHIDLLGLIVSLGWLAGGVILIRRWYLAAIVAGLGSWTILDVTGRLLARLDPLRGWSPSDTLWTFTGWIFCIAAALLVVVLRLLMMWIITRRQCEQDAGGNRR